ncbi:hypothetical protein BD780_002231 [Clostridium tetanomorphum]|uniref:Uncharacterized protein n=1 Tax=Clostridium tetanomorphum TaxID=1553 RepID=A0A923E8X3_CLOTT|nr:hypothetical protein [Clostridium tetanomorphum]KAJ53415.1 hypothetical protein CTM_02954 [Clostridium tetanomorphum DSM 665]MBC2396599.1 hypothetical protein [Clostridium tetanomorphum]MBP1863928.1 hypothetical protein [Clostridium tetanomorphum]NRS85006.1 hypothetical protein [Clostridium tetanomorphum]NRZ98222.1 hypothetical protein [Clostridium tetanomorphum]
MKENYSGVNIQGTIKEHENIRFIVEGNTRLCGFGWNRKQGERFEINIPFYDRNISKYPLENFNFTMNLPCNSKNITNNKIRVEVLNKREVIEKELYISDKESIPFIYYRTNNFKDIKKGNIKFEFYALGKNEIEENKKYIEFLIVAVVLLVLSNIYLFSKIKGGKS